MNTFEFLTDLKSKNIIVSAEDGRLKLSAPKGALTPVLKAELKARKEDLVAFLNQADKLATAGSLQPIEPVSREEALPLSYAQQRIWSLHQLEPEGTGFNVPVVWRLAGGASAAALQHSLNGLVRRHEILRTTFPASEDKPLVNVLPSAELPLNLVDLRDLPNGEREAMRLIEDEAIKRPFDISNELPMRVTLYHVGRELFYLLLNFHQIVFDWGAAGALVSDLSELYTSYVQGRPSSLPQLPIQYIDFANWQNQRLQGERLAELEQYWQTRLSEPYDPLQLPYDEVETDQGIAGHLPYTISPEITYKLKALSKRNGGTLFITMMAAFNVLLHGYTSQNDILLFSTAAQKRPEVQQLVGLFANPTAFRSTVHSDMRFVELLNHVRQVALGAYTNQELPFEKLIEYIPLQSRSGQSSLFQVLFLFQHQPVQPLTLPGIKANLIDVGLHGAGFDLRFFVEEKELALKGWLEYDASKFKQETMKLFLEQFLNLLGTIVERPNQPVSEFHAFLAEGVLATATSPVAEKTQQYIAPRNEMEARMVTIWENLLNTEPIGITDDYFNLGGHSLMATRLFKQIEVEFGVNLSLATLISASTIEMLVEVITRDETPTAWNSLIRIQAGNSERPPLFLMHGAGGNVLLYRDLAHHLGKDQPVYGLQAQGLDGSGDYLTTFEAMAQRYIEEIREVQPEGPYFLGGYCLGGAIAYEMAQQLRGLGQEVALVAMFETFNVQSNPIVLTAKYQTLHRLQNLWFHAENLLSLRPREMAAFFGEKASVARDRLLERGQTLFKNLARRLRSAETAEMPHVIIDKVNDEALEHYIPRPYAGDITLFRPQRDFFGADDHEFGWGDLVSGGVTVHQLDVNPRGMLVEPYVQQLAHQLHQTIDSLVQRAEAELEDALQEISS